MSFEHPSLKDLSTQTQTEVASRLSLGALLPRSVLFALSRAIAGAVYGAFGRLTWIYRQLFEDTAEGDELERRANLRRIFRKAGAYASGNITFTGTASEVPAGARARRADGVEFETTVAVAIVAGTATVPAIAVVASSAGNTSAATALTLSSPVAGVSANAVVAAGGMTGGADRESDETLRARLLNRMRNPPQGGAPSDYVAWALEVPGVTRAWALRAYPQPGTIGVTFVVDGDPGGLIPSGGKVAEVQAYIDPLAPATATPLVFAPGVTSVNVTVDNLNPDTPTVRAAISAALDELFDREASPGSTVYVSHIREAISNAAGEVDHVVTAPVADIVLAAGTIAQKGTVTYT